MSGRRKRTTPNNAAVADSPSTVSTTSTSGGGESTEGVPASMQDWNKDKCLQHIAKMTTAFSKYKRKRDADVEEERKKLKEMEKKLKKEQQTSDVLRQALAETDAMTEKADKKTVGQKRVAKTQQATWFVIEHILPNVKVMPKNWMVYCDDGKGTNKLCEDVMKRVTLEAGEDPKFVYEFYVVKRIKEVLANRRNNYTKFCKDIFVGECILTMMCNFQPLLTRRLT